MARSITLFLYGGHNHLAWAYPSDQGQFDSLVAAQSNLFDAYAANGQPRTLAPDG